MRLVGDPRKTDAGGTITDDIAEPPAVQAVATTVASGGWQRARVRHQSPQKTIPLEQGQALQIKGTHPNSAPRTAWAPSAPHVVEAAFLKVAEQYGRGGDQISL
jgi:hypothetical protein